jgi:large subunit ribosomal protein L3
MTHALVVDYRKTSTTSGQEVAIPVTVVEVPPMKAVAIRCYSNRGGALHCLGETWSEKVPKELGRLAPQPEKRKAAPLPDPNLVEEVRLLLETQPKLVRQGGQKKPELIETRVGGGTVPERLAYAKTLLGKDVKITDFVREGEMIDVAAVTKGKGWQGAVKRFGIKLLRHKNSKHRRNTGTLGSFQPGYVRPTVPQGGQMGYHQRTEYNKRVLKIGEDGKEITPEGGFLHYGVLRNQYVLLHGSIPGPTSRLVKLRDAARVSGVRLEEPPVLTYVSTQSKQGA